MYRKIKILNRIELAWFYIKYVLLIIIPVLILLLRYVIFDCIKPTLIQHFPLIVKSITTNAKSINDVSNILLGAFIPFAGTWAYNSSRTRGKNACYKKEVFYKNIYEDLWHLGVMFSYVNNKDYVGRAAFEFWKRFKDTIPAICINKTLRKFINNRYEKYYNIVKLKEEFDLLYIDKIFKYMKYNLKENGKYFFCSPLFELIDRNDETAIKEEIGMLFNRDKLTWHSYIDEIYSELFTTIKQSKEYCKINHDISEFKKDNSDLQRAVKYLIEFINKNYEASNNLA
jgi:hypothetical protein